MCKIHLKLNCIKCSCLSFYDHTLYCNHLTFHWYHRGLVCNLTEHRYLLVDDGELNNFLAHVFPQDLTT